MLRIICSDNRLLQNFFCPQNVILPSSGDILFKLFVKVFFFSNLFHLCNEQKPKSLSRKLHGTVTENENLQSDCFCSLIK